MSSARVADSCAAREAAVSAMDTSAETSAYSSYVRSSPRSSPRRTASSAWSHSADAERTSTVSSPYAVST